MLHNLLRGLTVLGNGPSIAYLVAGSLIGMTLGVIPGLGGAVILTVVLAFVYHISVTGTLCLFLATQAGSYFSSSITSILLNTPAHPEAFAVTFDGFPMAQRGEAGRALGISAASTCIGGLIGCAVLIGFIQIINYLPSIFHPPEYVALVIIAILLVGTLGTDAVSKALISTGIALMISTVGSDPINGQFRYTFGAVGLYGGISIVALFLGLFAIPQMVFIFGTASTIARQNMMGEEIASSAPVALEHGFGRQVTSGVVETMQHKLALLRAALIGVVTGVIPGIGGFAANFMSYGIAQQMSKTPERYGTGVAEGIIAPEGSSLAKEAGGMVPILGLGIPGGVGGALFLAALTIKGVKTGYGFTTQYPTLAYETVWVIALGGLIGTLAGVLTAPMLAKVTRVPGPAIVPFIMAISVVGTYAADISFFSVMEILVFGVVGFTLRRLRYSLAAFGIGLVLGPTLEINIYQTHEIFPGLTFLRRPLADVLFLLAIVLLIVKSVQLRRNARTAELKRREASPGTSASERLALELQLWPYPVLAVIATVALVGFCTAFAVYGGTHYNFITALMPVLGSAIAGVVALWRLPIEISGYLRYRRALRATRSLRLESGGETSTELSPTPVLGEGIPLTSNPPGTVAILEEVVSGELVAEADPQPQAEDSSLVVDKSWGRRGQYLREALAFAWLCALLAGCYVFGFDWGSGAFCLAYGLFATRAVFKRLPRRIIFSLCAAAVMWIVAYEIQDVLHLVFTPLVSL